MNKKYLVIGIILLGLALVGGGFLWWTIKSKTPPAEPSLTEQAETTSREEAEPEEVILEEEASPQPTKTDEELIAEAFAKKYNKPIEAVSVNISKKTGPFAQGGVKFTGEIGGAMWFAYKEVNDWLIVHDGHGTIPCSAIETYNFPTEMAPECWDEANNKLIQRT